jgi:hypothetical protein
MPVEWTFTAESYLDQLPQAARAQVLHALEGLPAAWDGLLGARLAPVKGNREDLFQLRVGGDLRVLLRRRGEVITVVDVVRRSQIDGLRRAALPQTAAG